MCGRYYLLRRPADFARPFQLGVGLDCVERYTIAPTQPVLAVGLDKAGRPAVTTLRGPR